VTVAFVKFADRKHFSTRKCLSDIREQFKEGIPGAVITVDKERNGPPTGKPINIEISGDDFAVLEQLQNEMYRKIAEENIQGIEELRTNLQRRKPEKILVVDKEKAQLEGISVAQIGMEMRTALFGKEISKFKDANDDAPIMLRASKIYRMTPEQLMNVNISFMDMGTGRFKQLPIGSVTRLEDQESFNIINRKNQNRVITLSSNVLEGYTAPDINVKLQKIIDKWKDIPEGYEVKLTGEQEDQKETSDFLGIAFIGALALMFLVMVTQFNSVIKPLMIFTTVLFSLIGVFLGFALSGMNFSIVMTGVGVFALAGIVIRNGILLIEFTDELRQRGHTVQEAVVEAGSTRMTPVILTATAAILGLIPLAIGFNIDFGGLFAHFKPHIHLGGDNVAFWGPLAWTMIFGLTVATFLTLLVVPSMYILLYKTKHKFLLPLGRRLGLVPKE
jgi:multidrug efflux pump subunit AcrB